MANFKSQDLLTAGKGSVIASTTAPVAHIGQRWFNTATGVTYQYTIDAAGTKFWLDISSGGIGAVAHKRSVDFVGVTDPHLETNGSGLAIGDVYYNREADRYFVCTTDTSDANVWAGRYAGTGGTETTYKSGSDFYRVHTFLSSGTFFMDGSMNVEYLVVAGGGTGGTGDAGGGGAGGYRTATGFAVTAQSYAITVGAGAATQEGSNSDGTDGGNSVFSTITSTGGGGGGGGNTPTNNPGRPGGSGGGGGGVTSSSQAGGAATPITSPVQGNAGGAGVSGKGGGGGGATAAGSAGNAGSPNGAGGAGTASTIRDGTTSVTYAAGGNGDNNSNIRTAQPDNTGNGGTGVDGGGAGAGAGSGAGGSGIVIIKYQLNA